MSSLALCIKRTLLYSDHFDFPLTAKEIHTRLIEKKATLVEVKTALAELVEAGSVTKSGIFYHLPARVALPSLRRQRERASKSLLTLAKRTARLLSLFPSVLAIYLTGSLAVLNADSEDDLDFLVICKNDTLWLTRIFITLLIEITGRRRRPGSSHTRGKICLNLYLSPASFPVPRPKQSLYTAYELVQARSLYDPYNTRAMLIAKNDWIFHYLPNYQTRSLRRIKEPRNTNFIVRLINLLSYHLQLQYMQNKLTSEYITLHSAYFHPHNPGVTVLRKLSKKSDL